MNKTLLLTMLALLSAGMAAAQAHDTNLRHDTGDAKPFGLYVGAGYNVRSLGGLALLAGADFQHHQVEVRSTFGLASSGSVHCYTNDGTDRYFGTMKYKRSQYALRYGYRLDLAPQLSLTPQAGFALERLSATAERAAETYGNGAAAQCITLGARLLYQPLPHISVFATPEVGVAVGKDDNFQRLADASDIKAGGLAACVGVMFDF